MRNTGPTPAIRDSVYQRSGFACERCGDPYGPFAVHHRLPRGRGGGNEVPNLGLLCEFGGCHDAVVESRRTEAYESGWLVRTGHDPATTPVLIRGRWTYLTADGKYGPCPRPDDDACTAGGGGLDAAPC